MSERIRYEPRAPADATSVARMHGFTVIELMVTTAIFVVVLGALGAMLTTSLRAYRVTGERSEAIQDSEAVLQLLRYEVALAGYRGIDAGNHARPFTLGVGDETIVVRRPFGSTSDELTIRYFEDQYLGTGDSGERQVTFTVTDDTLVRQELRPGSSATTTELLVGNILSMRVIEIVDRERDRFPTETLVNVASSNLPPELAGLNVLIVFVDEREWEFLIGVANPQAYRVLN